MPRASISKHPAPSLPDGDWLALYHAADRIRLQEPWEFIPPDVVLRAEHPVSGAPVYASVMGDLGEVFGLSIHHGPWAEYTLLAALVDGDDHLMTENLHRMHLLKVEFVKKSELSKLEKDRLKKFDFRPSGAISGPCWPQFDVMKEGSIPLPPDPEDAALLLSLLPRFAAMLEAIDLHFLEDPEEIFEGIGVWPEGRSLDQPLAWSEIVWRESVVPARPAVESYTLDESTLARLSALPQTKVSIELDAFAGFSSVDEGPRPYFVKIGLAVDVASKMIVGVEVGRSGSDSLEGIAGRLLVQTMDTVKSRPNEVRVQQEVLLSALQPLAAALNVKIRHVKKLPALNDAREAMPSDLGV